MATPTRPPAIQALLIALACSLCLVVAGVFHLEHANLAVWTSYMVMATVPITVFQRGFERTIGRGVGILAAVILVSVFPDQWRVRLLLECVLLMALFYGFFAGRLAYALLNAGLYLAVLLSMGNTRPEIVTEQGWQMFLAVLVGSLVSDLVVWLTGTEGKLSIDPGLNPLFPLRNDWLNHSLMLVVTVFLTLAICRFFELPDSASVVSAMLLTTAPDLRSVLLKGELRLEGALLGAGYSLGAFLVLSQLPYFSLMLIFVFAGTFVAGYLAKTLGDYSYLGVQMGLVIGLVLIVPPHEFGSIGGALVRLSGVVIALVCSVVVAGLWPAFPFAQVTGSTTTPPAGAKPG